MAVWSSAATRSQGRENCLMEGKYVSLINEIIMDWGCHAGLLAAQVKLL
jgi:hypothetical protein